MERSTGSTWRKLSRRMFGAALAVVVVGAGIGAQAWAAPPDSDAAARAVAEQVQADSQVPTGWTGSVAGCLVGAETQASRDATLHTANILRSAAGVGPVTMDPELNRKALEAALIMLARGGLSHYPGAEWACYTPDGAQAASRSNLALGLVGAGAMLGYVLDEGVPSLGHRRWLLNPVASVFGSGSTSTSNALWVVPEKFAEAAPGTRVAWPPAGYVPLAWLPTAWSVAIGGSGESVSPDNLAVRMRLDGQPVDVSAVTDLGPGYGVKRTVSWQPAITAGQLADAQHTVDVEVSGLILNGTPAMIAYTVQVTPWQRPIPTLEPDPPATQEPSAKPTGQPTLTPTVVPTAAATLAPTVTATLAPTVTATVPPGPSAKVKVKAVSRAGKLLVDVNPNLKGKWWFTVHKRGADVTRWSALRTYSTLGKKQRRTLNLPRGIYLVVVQGRDGYTGVASKQVALRR